MKKNTTNTNPNEEEIGTNAISHIDTNPKSNKKQRTRDGCLAGNSNIKYHKDIKKTGNGKGNNGGGGDGNGGDYVARARHAISLNDEVKRKDIKKVPRENDNDLAYDAVVGRTAVQKIKSELIIQTGMVK